MQECLDSGTRPPRARTVALAVCTAFLVVGVAACSDGDSASGATTTGPAIADITTTTTAQTTAQTTATTTADTTTTTVPEQQSSTSTATAAVTITQRIYEAWQERDGPAVVALTSPITGEPLVPDPYGLIDILFRSDASQFTVTGCSTEADGLDRCLFESNAAWPTAPVGFYLIVDSSLAEVKDWGILWYPEVPAPADWQVSAGHISGSLVGSPYAPDPHALYPLITVDIYELEDGSLVFALQGGQDVDGLVLLDTVWVRPLLPGESLWRDCAGEGTIPSQVYAIVTTSEDGYEVAEVRGAWIVDIYNGRWYPAPHPENLSCPMAEVP